MQPQKQCGGERCVKQPACFRFAMSFIIYISSIFDITTYIYVVEFYDHGVDGKGGISTARELQLLVQIPPGSSQALEKQYYIVFPS